mmetsp:Transcript_23125/g.92477  ORF Transcript_23125/g.92477 Transcript_23125/m.92477 type:complete len:135 (-) Transcript_23125:443-847(-)|eukprot:CAMPEP_0113963828 /NCGR_PEP_ID=MMETSP0011_2-20120614/6756_1 /TAXON_ID=101924 /ORGANISM="Rhodosorus marinus" /LENGTH=134 /DNA_ID=CAMNT_0000975973 /DNA_START=248 /DNA_END=652 /DNA_ORIENTATION=+ /assembly_acc=CAM_ASM_000156
MIPILGLGLMGVVALLRLRPDRLLGLGVGVFYGLTVSIATVLRVLPKKKQKKPMMVSDYISMKKVARRRLSVEEESYRREQRARETERYTRKMDSEKLAKLQNDLVQLKSEMQFMEQIDMDDVSRPPSIGKVIC